MPAWPGGACPECGDEMPARLIRCATCRALLNNDLNPERIELPEFVPLQEVESVIDAHPIGYYLNCPLCTRELRVHGKYIGQHVSCKFCHKSFALNRKALAAHGVAFYSQCPHCSHEIRAAQKYMGAKVACKYCAGAIQFVEGVPR